MIQTWNPLRTWRTHVIRVVLIAVAWCVSACTILGPPSSNPSAIPPDGGYAGTTNSGNGDGGSGM
jgi:hypothetical protein